MTLAGLGWLPWRDAVVATVVLLVLMGLLALSPRTRRGMRVAGEAALILALYAVWQVVAANTTGGVEGAADAGLWIARLQDALAFPSEAWLQQMVIGNESIIAVADWYYVALHIPMLVVTLLWVLFLHLRDWPFARTTIVLLTGMCLLVQFKPVAPPRLLPQLGIIDTALEHGRSVYGAVAGANQLSAMPSVHIAWASAVALIIIVTARTPWRWVAIGYPVLTLWVVVVTGNHFILDGVVSVLLLGLAVGITLCFPSQRPARLAGIRMPWEPAPRPADERRPDDALPVPPSRVR